MNDATGADRVHLSGSSHPALTPDPLHVGVLSSPQKHLRPGEVGSVVNHEAAAIHANRAAAAQVREQVRAVAAALERTALEVPLLVENDLVHSAQAQLGVFPLGLVGWTLLAMSVGLVQWRVWFFSPTLPDSSGIAWIGIWRVCFYSQEEPSPGLLIMRCSYIRFHDAFTPPEIAAAQILMFLSLGFGLLGFVCGIYALRNTFFGIKSLTRFAFCLGGASTLLAAVLALIPLLWNLAAVLTDHPIQFPGEFRIPESPKAQRVGGAVWAGLVGVALLVVTAAINISYKFPKEEMGSFKKKREGKDNLAFEFDEVRL